jgi:hypothetical protein
MDERQVYEDVQNHEGYIWTAINCLVFEIGVSIFFLNKVPFLNGTRQADQHSECEYVLCSTLRILIGESEFVDGSDFL